ncbi:restriction endonuclease subunit S [Enterococcus faecium]|jgi:restriction endonuclease S subunit|uniref:restriction endonuclease subunit S n=1 Tax=Enterococcus faecium TaxID=1352 RepID=UPI0018C258F7|nr:restriction endonuclease subunit S [Enterococcus faecium]MBG0423196.1 restriction endonuclease subunit S [Enterococcus faecium]
MKSNYDILGNHIRLIDTRNRESITDRVLGINIDKFFMPSVANVIGTDLSKYKLITKGKFACNPMHVGRDERLPVALYDEEEPAIVSPAYFMFEVIDNSILNEDYLMMWFRRPEFDRICWLHTDGSVRGGITWDDICRLELPIPPIEKQFEIVNSYKAITERIALKQKINDNLRASASIMFFNKIRYVQCSECCQETEIGRYPIEWTLSTLGDVLDTIIDRRGLTPTKLGSEWSNEGIIALSAKSVKNHELVNLDIANHVDNDLYNRWMPQKLQSQDILMTSEAPLGEFYYLADFSTYCLSQRLFAMRANKTIIEPTVLYFQLTDSIGKHQIDIRKTGTTVTGIRQSELIQVPIIVPPMNIQKEFARFCNPIMITIEKNADEIRQLFKLQEMLLSRLSR